jgi:hypothetical protein
VIAAAGFELLSAPAGPGSGTAGGSDAYLRSACRIPPEWGRYLYRGWNPGVARGWDLALVPRKGNWFGSYLTTSHSGPYDYLQAVPLVFYGPGFIKRLAGTDINREVTLADAAATTADLIGFSGFRRVGVPITEILKSTRRVPRLIVTVVIDGGGWNVLHRWPDSWHHLSHLMRVGASVRGAVVGSTPSITPAVHTTLSTALWPRQHGVMAIVARADDGAIVSGFARRPYAAAPADADPTVTLDSTTLADEWDLHTGNRAKVAMVASQAFHLGMIGHGSSLPQADRDIAAMTMLDEVAWSTNPEFFRLPSYVQRVGPPDDELASVDRADGRADGRWRGHEYWRIDATPAYGSWENQVARMIIAREGFGRDDVTDLFYINYKAPDAAGHKWNMISPEQGDVVESVDEAIASLMRFLAARVGSRRYVMIVTADHGQTPLSGEGWPVSQSEMRKDIERAFDRVDNGRGIVERTSTALYFLDRKEMERNDVAPEEIASYLSRYTVRDNVPGRESIPVAYGGDPDDEIFAAVVPGRRMEAVARCTGAFRD